METLREEVATVTATAGRVGRELSALQHVHAHLESELSIARDATAAALRDGDAAARELEDHLSAVREQAAHVEGNLLAQANALSLQLRRADAASSLRAAAARGAMTATRARATVLAHKLVATQAALAAARRGAESAEREGAAWRDQCEFLQCTVDERDDTVAQARDMLQQVSVDTTQRLAEAEAAWREAAEAWGDEKRGMSQVRERDCVCVCVCVCVVATGAGVEVRRAQQHAFAWVPIVAHQRRVE